MFRIEKNQRWKPGRAFWTAALLLIVFVVAQTISLLHIYWTYGISSYSSNIAYVHSSLDTASSVTTAPSLSSSYSSYVNRFSLLHQSFKSAFPRICYYNQHPGTASDFGHAVKSLGLDTPSFFNSKLLTDYGQSNKHADELLDNGMGDFFCDSFDIVVSGDTTPDVRFLMKRIDLSPDIDDVRPDVAQLRPCRLSKLVVQVTNRFDLGTWDIGFYEGYYTLIRRLAQRKDQKVQWVVNNPWEPRYMEFKMGQMVVNTTLIRPLGVSPVPAKSVSDAERGKAAFAWHPDIAGFTSLIEKHQLSDLITILPREYGGPATLAQYKAFVTVPYQSSTMKIYENLAHGVVTYIPSPAYYKEYFFKQTREKEFCKVYVADVFKAEPDNWENYFEYYNSDFKDYFYTFDSMDDLYSQLSAAGDADPRNLKQRGMELMKKIGEASLRDWSKNLSI